MRTIKRIAKIACAILMAICLTSVSYSNHDFKLDFGQTVNAAGDGKRYQISTGEGFTREMVEIAEGAGTNFDPGEMMDYKIKKVAFYSNGNKPEGVDLSKYTHSALFGDGIDIHPQFPQLCVRLS